MTMIKLIASDMDGTLVSSNHVISQANAEAIKAVQNEGVEFIITTGRSYEDSYPQVTAAGIKCNYLVMNGSELRDSTGKIIQSLYLEASLVEEIVDVLTAEGLYVELYTTGGTYSPSDLETSKWAVATKINNFRKEIPLEEAYQEAEDHFLFKEINRISSIQDIFEKGYKVGKIISFSHRKDKIAELRQSLPQSFPVNATGSFAINLEITNPLADKGQAIKTYAKAKQISLEEIMTIGDSFNDLGMLGTEFGYTVAMGNAIEEVKAQAKFTTDTNDADGVSKAIKKLFNLSSCAG